MIDDKSKPIYWIIAGTWNEYEDYVRDIRRNHPERLEQYTYRYVNDPIMLRGQRDIEGSFIGTWYLKPEATQIWAIIRASHVNPNTKRTLGMLKARMILQHHGKSVGARGAD
jgi:hypothetical protein